MITENRRVIEDLPVEENESVPSAMLKPFTDVSTAVLLLRVVLGVVFFAHGAQKVLGWWGGPGLAGTVQFMAGMGIPAFLAYAAAFTEFLGGIFLILGFLTRISAVGIGITMLVAIFMVHLKQGFFAPGGIEYSLTLGVISLVILLLGPGRYSVDYNLFHKK